MLKKEVQRKELLPNGFVPKSHLFMNRIALSYLVACLALAALDAQELHYGFRAGLNFSQLAGPSETDSDGTPLETWQPISGFNIGALFTFHFVERFGARTGLSFEQKGARYKYEGPHYRLFTTDKGSRVIALGDGRYSLAITTSWLNVPLQGYARIFDWLELSGGAYASILVGATATGEWQFRGSTTSGAPIDLVSPLEFNYLDDATGGGDFSETTLLELNGEPTTLPRALGAYYEFPRADRPYFNRFDYGLQGGVSLYLNQGLFVGLQYQYGLADLTYNAYDYSRRNLDNGQRIPRSDTDRNISWQASVGFSF